MDSKDEAETIEDRMLRQILEESLKQSKQEEQERLAASETKFQDQLRAAQEQNRLDQQKREQELEAQVEAELQEQIKQAIEMSAQAEWERVQKSKERAEQLLKLDREFGSRNQPGGIVRSATVASTTSSNARVVESRAPIRNFTVPSPPAGRDTGAPMVRSTRNELSVDRQRPISTPTMSARTTEPDTHRPSPTRTPSVSSTGTASGTVRQVPTRSSTLSSTRNEHDHNRRGLTRSLTVSPAGSPQNPISPAVVLPSFAESRSSSQPGDGGIDQYPDPSPPGDGRRVQRPDQSPPRERRTENGELSINNRSEISRRSTSSSTSSQNRPIRPTQGERTKLGEDNDGQRPSNRPQDLDPSIVGNTTSPQSSQLERSRTLPGGNRTERREDSRRPESRPTVNGSRPSSERSSSRPDHLPREVRLRTRTIHEGSRNSLPSRRPIVAKLNAPEPIRREASSRPRPAELRIPRSMSQETDPRATPTQPASPHSPSPRNSVQPGSTENGNPQRSRRGTPGATLPNEGEDTPVDLNPWLETAINNRPPTLTTLTEEELAGLTDEQMLERALSASTETRVLTESGSPTSGLLMEEDLAGMTEEELLERAMRNSAAMTLLEASRPALNLTTAQITALEDEQMQRATEISRGDDPEEAAKQREFDKLMSNLPRYHEIVGTWDEWHEKEKGIEPRLRPNRLPEYDVPSGSELTYVTSWAGEISLEEAMIISNRDKEEYWNRVKRGEITDTGTSQGRETCTERKAKGARQKAHLEAVAAIPTAKELEERWANGNPVSLETAEQDGQGGEGAATEAVQGAAEGPAHEGGGEGHVQSIAQINAQRENQRREQRNVPPPD
jgi:hypothetical protein